MSESASKFKLRNRALSDLIQKNCPERELVASVLIRAIRDQFEAENHVRREVAGWFRSPKTSPMSFIWCCQTIDICPKMFLQSIKNLSPNDAFGDTYKRVRFSD